MIEELKQEIQNFYLEKANFLTMCSKQRWAMYGEKNNKFFLGLQKMFLPPQYIYQIYNNEEELINDPAQILKHIKNYYADLYQNKPAPGRGTLKNNLVFDVKCIPHISESQMQVLESDITIQELQKAMTQTKLGKSPGIDRIPVDFYKIFWEEIKLPLFQNLVHSFEVGEFHGTQKRVL